MNGKIGNDYREYLRPLGTTPTSAGYVVMVQLQEYHT